jgi:predicted transcriptional regulator
MKDSKAIVVTIRFTQEQVEAIDQIASKSFRDRSSEIRKAIAEYINQHKDLLD